eukprot:1674466-Heterocapsa_arctica.AAC.1
MGGPGKWRGSELLVLLPSSGALATSLVIGIPWSSLASLSLGKSGGPSPNPMVCVSPSLSFSNAHPPPGPLA